MKLIPADLSAHLEGGVTTLCWCWRITRRDGTVMGFTDHDRALTFDGVTYEATSGFVAQDARTAVGLNVDNTVIEGALQSERISDADLANGDYDEAVVDLYRVNWNDVGSRVQIRTARLGEVTLSDAGFSAELRGLSHGLNQPQGRTYQRQCDARLGDARCGVDLTGDDNIVRGRVTDIIPGGAIGIELEDNVTVAASWFAHGIVAFIDGSLAGTRGAIRTHRVSGGIHMIEPWVPFRRSPQTADLVDLTVGCDKSFSTCGEKFSNAARFRGFPHLPSADYVTAYPLSGS